MLIRLHKYLADHGIASRRKCEEYIRAGLIKVNGKIVKEMGIKIDPSCDRIETAPQLKLHQQQLVYYALHKPAGYVCTVTGHEKPKITELLAGIRERIFPVGRLDKMTSGLLLLTNDGRFAYEMTHPKFEKEKEYAVTIRQYLTPQALEKLKKSISIHGKKTQPATITVLTPHSFRVILKEGRNRQIRRLCFRSRLKIELLKRIRIGRLSLGNLPEKTYRKLSSHDLTLLPFKHS